MLQPMLERRNGRWLCLVAGLALASGPANQQPTLAQEREVAAKLAAIQAAFLLKFASYVSPATPRPVAKGTQPTYRIGILGEDPTAAAVRKLLQGKKVGDAAVEVVAVSETDARAGRAAELCDLLYVATPADDAALRSLCEQHATKSVLLVSAASGFLACGGGIQMFVQDGNVLFEVNAEVLQRQNLVASSQLLRLSRRGGAR